MKKLRYIFLLLIAVLSGFAISSCEDDDVVAAEVTEETTEGSGETVKTTFTINLSAPDVSADLDPVTRAGDNANIEYAKPENGGRFQNIVVVLVDNNDKIKGVHCHNWGDNVGVKEYNVIFSDIEVPATGVDYKVYAFGNVCEDHYKELKKDTSSIINKNLSNDRVKGWPNIFSYCVNAVISVDDPYKISFKPGETYKVGLFVNSAVSVTSTGMPVNNSATATVVKGNTQFNVALKRVCARLQVTFRNFTGKTDYDDTYYGNDDTYKGTGNRVYVDNFVLKKALATSTSYFYNGSAPSSTGSVNFDILEALGGTNDHKINKIENGEDLVVSMYVFENKKGTATGAYTYDLKVDRGKSLGKRAESLQDGNVYVMWSDNIDPGTYENDYNRCLGVEKSGSDYKFIYVNNKFSSVLKMNTEKDLIPFGSYSATNKSGNRLFWRFNGSSSKGTFENCDVDLSNDVCVPIGKYINESAIPKLGNSGQTLTIGSNEFEGFNRNYLMTRSVRIPILGNFDYTLMISNDKFQERDFPFNYLPNHKTDKSCYPWVFFAKYIIKNGQQFKDKAGAISQIERNHSYELDFSVMPNYETKQEILVNCIRKQNEVNWSEVQK